MKRRSHTAYALLISLSACAASACTAQTDIESEGEPAGDDIVVESAPSVEGTPPDRHAAASDEDDDGVISRELDASQLARIDIDDVGVYFVSSLSRVGWDIDHSDNVPGAVHIPDVAIGGISSPSQSDLLALAELCASDFRTHARLELEGASTEVIVVELRSIAPVSCVTDTETGLVSELVLSVPSMEVLSYTAAEAYPAPVLGRSVEIEGFGTNELAADAVDAPPVGEQGSISVRELRDSANWIDWMQMTLTGIEQIGAVEQRDVTVFDTSAVPEIVADSSVTYHEAWPYRLDLFDPSRPYGSTHLVDAAITFSWSEAIPPGH